MDPAPPKLTGKEFEDLLLEAAARQKDQLIMGRYGVQANMINGVWTPVRSYPDFEGVRCGGRQFIIEAKACSESSFPLKDDHFRDRQYKHMCRRALYGVECFLLIHFNYRKLKKSEDPACTIRIPVDPGRGLWKRFEAGDLRSISREMAREHGTVVAWTTPPRCKKSLPEFL